MKKKIFLKFLTCLFVFYSCAYKPLYKKKSGSSHKINIIVKSDDYDKKIPLMMKASLNQKLNTKKSRPSNLKLIISLSRSTSALAFNKDFYSSGKILNINIQYTFYDKKGVILTGSLQNKSSYFMGNSPYANLVSEESATKNIISSLSESLSNVIVASKFNRTIVP
tara:strand:+ start:13 stop:510 length:498 start_codon:yes stop_codon:yes gene_type:complete